LHSIVTLFSFGRKILSCFDQKVNRLLVFVCVERRIRDFNEQGHKNSISYLK